MQAKLSRLSPGERFRKGIRKYGAIYVALTPFFILFICFILIPMIEGMAMSFTDWSTSSKGEINFVGFENYSKSLKMTEKEKKKDNVGTGCLTTFIGAWIGLFTGLGLLAIVAKPGMEKGPTIAAFAGGLLLGELITWVAARVIIRKGNEKDAARMKALEDVEKKEPYFIAWAEQTSDIIGMSLH